MSDIEQLLAEQARYYRERAGEYDDWWLRRGRYDRGADANARWFVDAAEVEDALERFQPAGQVLELACGTGLWTRRLVGHADAVTAVDASPEVIELARAGLDDPRVSYVCADLFAWEPPTSYDVCFFSFWLSHVPEARFETFWARVARALRPGGRVFFVDSLPSELASAADHRLPDRGEETMTRRLADGREFRIVKRFYEPPALRRRLAGLGWDARVQATPEFFIYGQATRASERVVYPYAGDALVDLIDAVRAIPYGRPSDRTIEGMLRERRGTCSTKHLYLAQMLTERFPDTSPMIVHRVYTLDRARARKQFGAAVAKTVPDGGLVDVHRYITIALKGRRIEIDVTFPGPRWDGRSSMPLACGLGRDYPAGDDPDTEKRALEQQHCDPVVREPFIAALSSPEG